MGAKPQAADAYERFMTARYSSEVLQVYLTACRMLNQSARAEKVEAKMKKPDLRSTSTYLLNAALLETATGDHLRAVELITADWHERNRRRAYFTLERSATILASCPS